MRTLSALIAIAATLSVLRAQPQNRPHFEAAVVKPAPPIDPNSHEAVGCYVGPGLLQYNCTGSVKRLVAESLNLSVEQWPGSEDYYGKDALYAVTGKVSTPATREDMDAMLNSYLREAFNLRYHFEKRPIEAYFLSVVSKDLLSALPVVTEPTPFAAPGPASLGNYPRPRFLPFAQQDRGTKGETESKVRCSNITFPLFAQAVSRYFAVPVIDETGSALRFNMTITLSVDPDHPGPGSNLGDLVKVLKNYGVNLQKRRGTVNYLAIDGYDDPAK
jgi:uncharacterized protein (TIGR03435 family)